MRYSSAYHLTNIQPLNSLDASRSMRFAWAAGSRVKAVLLAFLAIAAGAVLSGCQKAAVDGASGPLPALQGGAASMEAFRYNASTLGCVTSGGTPFTLRFDKLKAVLETSGGQFPGVVKPFPGTGGFAIDLTGQVHQFVEAADIPGTVREAHVVRFTDSQGRRGSTCFTFSAEGYVAEDFSLPWLAQVRGAWNCSGDLGAVRIVDTGASTSLTWARGAGQAVFSSPRHSSDDMTLYALSDVTKTGLMGSVQAWPMAVRGNRMLLAGQKCEKVPS
jgi:hypothetical protein